MELGVKIVVQKGKRKSVTCCNRHQTFSFLLAVKVIYQQLQQMSSLDSPTKSRSVNNKATYSKFETFCHYLHFG